MSTSTQLNHVAEELSEETFRAALDNIPQLAWMADENGWLFWYNRRWLDYTGTSIPEMEGWGWQKVHHPDHLQRVTEKFKEAIAAGVPWEDTFPLRSRNGEYRWFLSRAMPLRTRHGKAVRWFGTNTDITESRAKEQELLRFKIFSDNATEAHFLITRDLRIVYVNRAACAQLGYTEEELLNLSIPEIDPEFPSHIVPRGSNGEPLAPLETIHRRKDGTIVPVEVNATMVELEGELLVFARVRDITLRKQASAMQSALVELGDALREATDTSEIVMQALAILARTLGTRRVGYTTIHEDAHNRVLTLDWRNRMGDELGSAQLKDCWIDFSPALAEGETVVVNDVETDPRTRKHAQKYLANQVRAFIYTPIQEAGGVMGMFYVQSSRIRIWSVEELRFVSNISDRTWAALKRAATLQTLQETDRRFRTVFNLQFQFMAILSPQGIVLEINDLPLNAIGAKREEVIGKIFWETLWWKDLPEMREQWPRRLKEAAMRDGPVISEDRYQVADGKVQFADAAITAVKDKQGNVEFFIVQASDITERKKAEAALQESESTLRTFYDNAPVLMGVVELTGDNRIIHVYDNPATSRFFNANGAIRGRSAKELGAPEEAIQRWIEAYRESEAKARPVRFEYLHPLDHGARWLSAVVAPLPSQKPGVSRFCYVGEDITDRKRAEEALMQAQEDLGRINEELEGKVHERTDNLQTAVNELEHFSYTITHDMRAPLRSMRSFGQILLAEATSELTPEHQDYLRRIVKGAERMDNLIQDALNYSKVVRSEFVLVPVDTATLLRDIVNSYPAFQEPNAFVEISGSFPCVLGNEAGLTQCFSNLLTNAVKFVPKGDTPRVRIWTETRDDRVRFWFEDNGIGVPPEHQERIFGMFERLSLQHEGTGIGLALVRKAAERMCGTVGVESEPGRGSRFWLEFQNCSKSASAHGTTRHELCGENRSDK